MAVTSKRPSAGMNGVGAPAAPPPVAVPLYSQSSQFRTWRYSEKSLANVRAELNVRAVGRVRSKVEEERAQQSSAPIASTSDAPPPSEIEYLTVSDEQSLVTYYLTQVSALCSAFQFPEMVEATATSYLKRFYLWNTCMDYHPKNVMLTCVFLATKTENHYTSIDTFAAKIKTTPKDIISLEFVVSQSLRFEYKVHHAHLALAGLSVDLKTSGWPSGTVDAAFAEAQKNVKASRLTDLEFIYTPSQIALGAFRLANSTMVDNWLASKEGRRSTTSSSGGETSTTHDDLERDKLAEYIVDIGTVISSAVAGLVDKETVKEVDRRLRWAHNPEKDPKSALYKKRQAEEEAQRDERAIAKAGKRNSSNTDNVFLE